MNGIDRSFEVHLSRLLERAAVFEGSNNVIVATTVFTHYKEGVRHAVLDLNASLGKSKTLKRLSSRDAI